MMQWRLLQKTNVLLVVFPIGICLWPQLVCSRDIYWGTMKANRILFFGNSITVSLFPVEGTSWTGGWGMAASSPSKDYVHLLTKRIGDATGAMPDVMATYNRNWETNYATYDLTSLEMKTQLAFKPDVVIVAVGENTATLSTTKMQMEYAAAFGNLLSTFKANDNPTVFVRSCFWPDPIKDGIMRRVAAEAGMVFVDQSSLDNHGDVSLWASQENDNPYHAVGNGVNIHPGDRGMEAIAGSLYDAMAAHCVPEPNSTVLCLLGIACVLTCVWRRRILSLL